MIAAGLLARAGFRSAQRQRITAVVVLADPSGSPLPSCDNPAVDPPRQGATAVLRDEADHIIGVSHLPGPAVEAGNCSVSVTFDRVPIRSFYTVTIEGRVPSAFSQQEVKAGHGKIQLTR